MKIKSFTFNPFQENTYVLYDDTNECIIVDPGCYFPHEEKELQDFLFKKNLSPKKLINTHCHIDHIFGNNFVKNTWGIDLYIHKKELEVLESSYEISKIYGFDEYKKTPNPDFFYR